METCKESKIDFADFPYLICVIVISTIICGLLRKFLADLYNVWLTSITVWAAVIFFEPVVGPIEQRELEKIIDEIESNVTAL